nr:hypothetical protein [Bradyrhizobium sp. SZCCHNR1085]
MRYSMGLGVRPHAHSGPRHCLDMHRPEGLDGTAARAGGQLERTPQTALLTLQFGLYSKGFRIDEDAQPARKSALIQAMLTAISALAEAASTPRLDVHRPKGSARFVLILFPPHKRFSMLQENPIWNDEAYSKDVRGPDAYQQRE